MVLRREKNSMKKVQEAMTMKRRRIESYLGEYVCFRQTQAGKNVYISMDGTENTHNPLYKAFKSKSFTDKDITLHFIILDILADGNYYTLKSY